MLCAPASGSTFPQGTTTVNCSATDATGNTASDSFDVNVGDSTDPDLTLPGTIVAEATGPSGAVVTYTVGVTDSVDPSPHVSCAPASGAIFPLGTTTVICNASDSANNASSGSFNVVVRDTTDPDLTLPGTIVAEATGPSGTSVSWTAPTADDSVSGNLAVTCSPASGSTFPLGTTSVTCNASDAAGNTSAGSFNVIVRDTTDPVLGGVPGDKSGDDGQPVRGKRLVVRPVSPRLRERQPRRHVLAGLGLDLPRSARRPSIARPATTPATAPPRRSGSP